MSKTKRLIKKALIILFFTISSFTNCNAQSFIIGFYNCENFYDTTNQLNVIDEEFLPGSLKSYNSSLYQSKTIHIAQTLLNIGNIENATGIALMGLVEIENKKVLENLVSNALIKKFNYKILHFDSKDARGIDVALLYNPSCFKPFQYKPFTLSDSEHFKEYKTRDILYVKGALYNNTVHILVNHWPSRRGGAHRSSPNRLWASDVSKNIIDSIRQTEPEAKFIMMGDFNDNPVDKSVLQLPLYNPFNSMYKKGMGSIAYKDSWHLFDQILLSENLRGDNLNIKYCKSIIYKNSNMIESTGRYQGYPKRTWNGNQYNNGFSDHLPVALIFTLKSAENELK